MLGNSVVRSRRRLLYAGVTLWLLILALAGPLRAAEELVLATGEYAPYTGRELPGQGMATEILTRALDRADLAYRLRWQPWSRSMEELRAGAVDGTFPWNPGADDRPSFSVASHPLYHIEMRFYRAAENDLAVDGLEDLRGRAFCRPEGYSLISDTLIAMVEDGRVRHASPKSMKACFRMLAAGRVDLVLPDSALEALPAIRAAMGSARAAMPTDHLLARIPMALLMTDKRARSFEALAAVDRELAAMEKSGEMSRIRERHRRLLMDGTDR